MEGKYFGEGMTVWHDKLVQITWKSHKGFIYDRQTLEMLQDFKFTTTNNEGWGITYDWCKDEFIVTDGSPYLHFWDTATLKETRKIKAHRLSGDPATNLNEIEYWRGRILVCIDQSRCRGIVIYVLWNSYKTCCIPYAGKCLVRRCVASHQS